MTFKLRSGNGPLPFKQMGASPAKQTDPTQVPLDPSYEKEIMKKQLKNNFLF